MQQADSLYPLISPVPDLLKSNKEPTSQQVKAIHEAIRLVEKEIEYHNFMGLESWIGGPARYAALLTFLTRHKAILSPVRRISSEILSTIFWNVALGYDGDVPTTPPYTLGYVCRSWRFLVLSIPKLLSTLPPLPLTKSNSLKTFLRKVPSYSPLSFTITEPISTWDHPVIKVLCEQSNRWRDVSLTIKSSALRPMAMARLMPHKFSSLRSLHIYLPDPRANHACSLTSFEEAPQLKEVEIDCLSPIFIRLPWLQLTKYRERGVNAIGVTFVLRDKSPIEHLEYINVMIPSQRFIAELIPSASLPHLKHCDIRIYHDYPVRILGRLTMPALESIRVRDHGNTLVDDIVGLITRSACGLRLTSLSFHTKAINSGELVSLLKLIPMLVELECNDIPFLDLYHLRVSPERNPLVPRLLKLTLHNPTSITDIVEMVESRSNPSATLIQTLLVSFGVHFRGLSLARLVFTEKEERLKASVELGIQRTEIDDLTDQLASTLKSLRTKKKSPRLFRSMKGEIQGYTLNSLVKNFEKCDMTDRTPLTVSFFRFTYQLTQISTCS